MQDVRLETQDGANGHRACEGDAIEGQEADGAAREKHGVGVAKLAEHE